MLSSPNPIYDTYEDLYIDAKAHSYESGPDVLTNDFEAIRSVVADRGEVGFFIVTGNAYYDNDGEFKRWHDQLKGKKSAYCEQREEENRPSRQRKVGFDVFRLDLYVVSDNEIQCALNNSNGYHVVSQGRNSNGATRPDKLLLDTDVVTPVASYT